LSIFIGVLDGLVLQVILTALVTIAAVVLTVWFIWGVNKKSAVWVIALSVPAGIIIAVVLTIVSG